MKRKEILKELVKHGFTFSEGGNHTLVFDSKGNKVSCIGRHTEIPKLIVREIEKQTGVKLL